MVHGPGASASWEDDAFPPDPEPAAVLPLTSLPPGARVDAPFLIREIQHRGGDYPHTILLVGNASGTLPSAPIWASDRHRLEGLVQGQPVRLRGSIGLWRERPQLIIDSLEILPSTPAIWGQLLPTAGDPAPYWRIIDTQRARIQSQHLQSLLAIFFDDNDFRDRFSQCPGSLSGHHGKIGGLLQHTCEVAHFSRTLAETVSRTEPELLVTAALLHDIGKLQAYRWDGAFVMTTTGRSIGHVVLGALMLDRAVHAAPEPPCAPEELELLLHLLLSHHGQLVHGAPVTPMTLEAELLHLADQCSARGTSMRDALDDDSLFPDGGEISTPVWQLDRRRVWRRECAWGRERGPDQKRSDRQARSPAAAYHVDPEVDAGAASQALSRTGPSHGTPRR
jgi:3'-5' exoribonuclease